MVDKASRQVRRMFASVAHRYDLLNHLLSLSIDRYWRRVVRKKLFRELPPEPRILDLCTGTGDLALTLAAGARIVGCDFCRPMLDIGRSKADGRGLAGSVRFVEGDALALPFRDASFDAVTIAFGLRNLEDHRAGLREMARVIRPGGRIAILEFSIPTVPVLRQAYLFYFTRILPRIGALVSGSDGPYSYLPASVREFPPPPELCRILEEEGFCQSRDYGLSMRIASLILATRDGG
ncbi:MAG: bifunctional demethylmenaquinone methyltransferase/2-methoxy-6-polyprenyl-1,4-benzoquinol methylase UbiE [Acidobacteriota bacterium]